MKRYLHPQVLKDLQQKMVFLAGPRQVGKTTLAKGIGPAEGYLNWDYPQDRKKILTLQLPEVNRWIFDEIHKYKSWRNHLKGLYDKFGDEKEILVTGSARLDLLRRGGDSLQGRYHFLRLYPITLDELGSKKFFDLEELFKLSGFPEPFLSSNFKQAQRWSNDYRQRILQEDISSVEQIEDLGKAELMLLNLPGKVGSPLSLNSLREDLEISHRAVKRWMEIFERFYAVFTLSPFGYKSLRSVKKERKHYHYDWTLVEDEGFRFENLMAVHLLKRIHFLQDTTGTKLDLMYFRDTDKREVDFVVTKGSSPLFFVETKLSDQEIAPSLTYLQKKFPHVPAYQVSYGGKNHFVNRDKIVSMPAHLFLGEELDRYF